MRASVRAQKELRLPDEIWDRILGYATAFSSEDPEDPFLISNYDEALATRLNICLVSHEFLNAVQRYLFADICIEKRLYLDHSFEPESLPPSDDTTTALVRLRQLAEQLQIRAEQGCIYPSRIRRFMIHQPNLIDAKKGAVQLSFLLSRCSRLQMFSTNFYAASFPWLPMLVHKAATTLTHLDIDFDATHAPTGLVEHINLLPHLQWLRLSDFAMHEEIVQPTADSMPALKLPLLRHLEVISGFYTEEVHPGGHVPFLIAANAVLPALTTLRITGHGALPYDGTPIVNQLGTKLEDLQITLPEDSVLDRMHTLAPRLRSLNFFIGRRRLADDDAEPRTFTLKHPTLRRLAVSGNALLESGLLTLEPAELPQLEQIQLRGISWASWGDVDDEAEEKTNYESALRVATKLAMKGLPVLDDEMLPFGD